jgi:hypothetical protein
MQAPFGRIGRVKVPHLGRDSPHHALTVSKSAALPERKVAARTRGFALNGMQKIGGISGDLINIGARVAINFIQRLA